jgi:hypothetical protein
VEIKESHQDDANKAVEIFNFTLTAQFGLPTEGSPAPTGPAASSAPAANTPPARKPGNT